MFLHVKAKFMWGYCRKNYSKAKIDIIFEIGGSIYYNVRPFVSP